MEIQGLIDVLGPILNFWGVVVISLIITLIFIERYIKTRSRQLLNSLPGLFTSLGLLGTFVAICNSLGTINEDNLQIDEIIRNLVPAFTSSIAGLICAFIATMWCKIIYAKEDRELDKKVNKISPEECLYNLTLLSEQTNGKLSNISQQLIDQAVENKAYNDRLNTTIGDQSKILEKFIENFVKRMDDIFTKMHGQIEQNIKDFGEEQFKKCADTLEILTQKMSSLSTGLLEEQKTNVQQMISGTNKELQSVSDTVKEQIDALCSQMTSTLTSLRSSQDERLTAIIANYDAMSERLTSQNSDFAEKMNTQMTSNLETLQSSQEEKLTAIITNYSALAERLSTQNSDFAEKMNAQLNAKYEKIEEQSANSLQQMVDLKDAYTVVNQEMIQSCMSMNREVSAELRSSLSSLVADLHKIVTDEVNVLSTALATNVEALDKSYAYISDHVRNIKGNYESAAQAYIDAVNTAHRMNESQENMLTSINDSMKHVVYTNEKVDEVITVIEERQERIENLISHINEINTVIESLQKLESQLNRIANK